jgi:hypothetical protein
MGKKKKKGKQQEEIVLDVDIPQLHKDYKLRELYSNLFYLYVFLSLFHTINILLNILHSDKNFLPL